ncbi:MAG: hypothetical protein IKY33_02625 [Clostridia bacterium]|nr:hypothetical protein [Clostridia bacterium]
MKRFLQKTVDIFKWIFGYGIMIALFAGGATFFGYLAAIIIGGNTAATICTVIYEHIVPVIIYATSILVLFGLLIIYLSRETALTARKKKK